MNPAVDNTPDAVSRAIAAGDPIDLRLRGGVRLYVDRPVPFTCVYRRPDRSADRNIKRLVTSQASYAVAADAPACQDDLASLLGVLSAGMCERFGGFLILEVWECVPEREERDRYDLQPSFQIHAPNAAALEDTIAELENALQRICIHQFTPEVSVCCTDRPAPPGLDPLDDGEETFVMGLEVDPIYRDEESGRIYPFLFENLRRQLADALRQGAYAFACSRTNLDVSTAFALGRRLLERAASEVDEGLAEIDESFDFLLQITPINAEDAFTNFCESGYESEPVFRYRPLGIDPELLKRRLYGLPVEHVEDPSLSLIFREKQEELDRKISMLRDRDTRQFVLGSFQLYGEVESALLESARDLLAGLPSDDYDLGSTEHLDAVAFSEMAGLEMTYYRPECPEFPETVHVRRDMPPGLMVSQGRLLIGSQTKIPAPRVEALLQHEIGTHMLTYYNGRAQSLRLLYNGLAGYEALQEGIAVLAEHLVGGLSVPRLRVLAARVVAAHCVIEGAGFVDVFRMLRADHGFGEHEAFSISTRLFRGGGLIKDVIYLRGLHELMHYLAEGGRLDPLFVGKIALHHLPVLEELHHRGVLKKPPLVPRYLLDERARERLEGIRQGGGLLDLIDY